MEVILLIVLGIFLAVYFFKEDKIHNHKFFISAVIFIIIGLFRTAIMQFIGLLQTIQLNIYWLSEIFAVLFSIINIALLCMLPLAVICFVYSVVPWFSEYRKEKKKKKAKAG